MADFTYSQLAADQSTLGSNLLQNLANGAANAVCSLYANYPTGILPSVGSTPVSALATGLLDSLCGPRGLQPPSPPESNFTGGQCEGTIYSVSYFCVINGVPTSGTVNLEGPIGGIVYRGSNPAAVSIAYGKGQFFNLASNLSPQNGPLVLASSSITGIFSVSGPDDCGDIFPTYNPTLPPSGGYSSTNFPIAVNVNGTILPLNFTLIPTVVNANLNFRPEFNVDVGGIRVNFNLGGVNFYVPSDRIPGPIRLPGPDTRPTPPPAIPPGTDQEPCDLTPVLTALADLTELAEDIKDCACGPGGLAQQTNYGPARARVINLPPRSQSVTVEVVSIGSQIRSQSGNSGGENVIYVGWYAFGRNGGFGDRKPLSYQVNSFEVPRSATTFTYSVVFKSTATLTVRYLVNN